MIRQKHCNAVKNTNNNNNNNINKVIIIIIIIVVAIIRILHKFCGTPTKTQIKADTNTNIHAINYSFLRMEDPCLKTHTRENIKKK